MHPFHDPYGHLDHHRAVLAELRRNRLATALRRQARAQRRAAKADQHARQAAERTYC